MMMITMIRKKSSSSSSLSMSSSSSSSWSRRFIVRQNGSLFGLLLLLFIVSILNSSNSNNTNLYPVVLSMPYILLVNKAPHCRIIDFHTISSHTKYSIRYHAPDMIIADEMNDMKLPYNNIIPPTTTTAGNNNDGSNNNDNNIADRGLDIRYQERQQKRFDLLKRSDIKDVVITITPRDRNGVMITSRSASQQGVPVDHVPMKHREPLEERSGAFEYYTGNINDGTFELCIQSYTANVEHPSRVSVTWDLEPDINEIEASILRERQLLVEQMHIEKKIISTETSRITAELMRLHRRAKALSDDTQYSKQSESEFHAISVKLNSAIKHWYIFRVLILLIGSYIQVSYIIKHMKSKHIY